MVILHSYVSLPEGTYISVSLKIAKPLALVNQYNSNIQPDTSR